jgi:hypothetical protein
MQTTAVECEQINFNTRYVHEFSSVGQRERVEGIVEWMKGIRHIVAEKRIGGGQIKHTQQQLLRIRRRQCSFPWIKGHFLITTNNISEI